MQFHDGQLAHVLYNQCQAFATNDQQAYDWLKQSVPTMRAMTKHGHLAEHVIPSILQSYTRLTVAALNIGKSGEGRQLADEAVATYKQYINLNNLDKDKDQNLKNLLTWHADKFNGLPTAPV